MLWIVIELTVVCGETHCVEVELSLRIWLLVVRLGAPLRRAADQTGLLVITLLSSVHVRPCQAISGLVNLRFSLRTADWTFVLFGPAAKSTGLIDLRLVSFASDGKWICGWRLGKLIGGVLARRYICTPV